MPIMFVLFSDIPHGPLTSLMIMVGVVVRAEGGNGFPEMCLLIWRYVLSSVLWLVANTDCRLRPITGHQFTAHIHHLERCA